MRYIKSCGFVVYSSIDGEDHYLIIKSNNGDVGFPKGHREAGESELETALRELSEEVSLEVNVVEGFRREIRYKLSIDHDAVKQAVYFLGYCKDTGKLKRQESEVADARFVSLDEAMSALSFEDTRRILSDAHQYIKKNALSKI